jgi:outer membrane protein
MINKKSLKVVFLVLAVLGLFAGNYYVLNKKFEKRVVWMNLSKVYNEFGLKKELEAKFKTIESARMKLLDSLELNLKITAQQLNSIAKPEQQRLEEFEYNRQQYLAKKQQFEEDNVETQKKYNEQIMTQINQYVKDFAAENNYSVILGAEGSGALMYAEESIEVTNDITAYINLKYKGN